MLYLRVANVTATKGSLSLAFEERSPALRVGLEEGDVIMQVNRQRVKNIRDMSNLIEDIQGNIVLGIKRGRDSVFILIQ